MSSKEWVKQEFGDVDLGDKHLRDRLLKIVEDRFKRPDASFLAATCWFSRYSAIQRLIFSDYSDVKVIGAVE